MKPKQFKIIHRGDELIHDSKDCDWNAKVMNRNLREKMRRHDEAVQQHGNCHPENHIRDAFKWAWMHEY